MDVDLWGSSFSPTISELLTPCRTVLIKLPELQFMHTLLSFSPPGDEFILSQVNRLRLSRLFIKQQLHGWWQKIRFSHF